jgi:hypothetical protein
MTPDKLIEKGAGSREVNPPALGAGAGYYIALCHSGNTRYPATPIGDV